MSFDIMQAMAALCLAGDGSGSSAGRHSSPVNCQDATEAAALAGQQDNPPTSLPAVALQGIVCAAICQATCRVVLLMYEQITSLLKVSVCHLGCQ